VDATASENISRYGIRFEIRDADGDMLLDPFAAGQPLQPQRSAVPGAPPTLYSFEPPRPGTYTVRIILTNDRAPGVADAAEVTVVAVNTQPEAFAAVMAGPNPPSRTPASAPRASSGLRVVRTGEQVYLRGIGLDRNHATPEQYNRGGLVPDIYGKNNDHRQRQFSFRWQLFHVDADGVRTERSGSLRNGGDEAATTGQFLHFTADRPGRFEAVLEVSDNDVHGALTSRPATLSVLVANDDASHDGSLCADCHTTQVDRYGRTAHSAADVGCERCHGPAAAHLAVMPGAADYDRAKRATMDVSYESDVCGQCHAEYAEWEKSRHADGMPFGYYEIGRPLLVQCSKCHYAETFKEALRTAADKGITFHEVDHKIRVGGSGPLMPDMSKVAKKDATGMACTSCHDPHAAIEGESFGLRTGEPGPLCQTCHEEKWQNTVLEGTAGEVQNGYEYPGEDYEFWNPHNTEDKCVLCHLGDETAESDERGVRAVGGHTLRMRDAGPNGALGGFGPRPDDPAMERDPADDDDILHLAACRSCHRRAESFEIRDARSELYAAWSELGELLRSANSGLLPDYRPGDKCATCHRGGTLPFDDDPRLVLENAYTNYKLIKNDRSWGVHNPRYVKKLLADSIAAVQSYLATHGPEDG
jgi:predicted CXXCH cytochrome family protein